MTELQKRWLEALESGKYRQGSERLRRGNYYCCLGVACDIYQGGKWKKDCNDYYFQDDIGNVSNIYLPVDVMRAFGFHSSNGSIVGSDLSFPFDNLVDANDAGVPFAQIAAIVRANPEKFFTLESEASASNSSE